MRFDSFSLVLLLGRPDAPVLDEATAASVQDGHLAHLADMHDSGDLLTAGPVAGEGQVRVRGICLFGCSAERAAELMAEDPAVRAGRFAFEVLPWRTPSGGLRYTPHRMPRSIADVRAED
jgi:uncharacterized protein YciI